MRVSNHQIENFLACRQKWILSSQWTNREPSKALCVGKIVHKALEEYGLSQDSDKALRALIQAGGDNEAAIEEAFNLMEEYFSFVVAMPLDVAATETSFEVPLARGMTYSGRMDGLVSWQNNLWVLEHKTSGRPPGSFFKQFAFNRQALGYMWAAEKVFGAVAGVCIEGLFKVKPIPKFERRFLRYTSAQVEEWRKETEMIVKDMKRAQKNDTLYKSRKCFGFGTCEYYLYCVEKNERVLETTHKRRR